MISWFEGCGLCSGAVDAVGAVGAVAAAPAAAAVGVVVVVVLLFILIDLAVLHLVLVVGGYLEVATFCQKYQFVTFHSFMLDGLNPQTSKLFGSLP